MSLEDKLKRKGVKLKKWKRKPEILLCPNIPKPLHGVAPRVIMGAVWWNKTRNVAYKSTGYHCVACGVWKLQAKFRQWLEGHEVYEIDYQKGRATYIETVPLCHACHNYIHDGRLHALLLKKEVAQSKFVAIIQYGDKVLAEAGLKRNSHSVREQFYTSMVLNNQAAKWQDWRMVFDGKEYPPKFKTSYQWERAMNK